MEKVIHINLALPRRYPHPKTNNKRLFLLGKKAYPQF
jgi:hypothetical protein